MAVGTMPQGGCVLSNVCFPDAGKFIPIDVFAVQPRSCFEQMPDDRCRIRQVGVLLKVF
jgi:hypothetical protein